jgi:hypothetical protein
MLGAVRAGRGWGVGCMRGVQVGVRAVGKGLADGVRCLWIGQLTRRKADWLALTASAAGQVV